MNGLVRPAGATGHRPGLVDRLDDAAAVQPAVTRFLIPIERDGNPLTGVELGRMFGRSPRWGTSRIAEVRSADITRRAARAPQPNGNGGRSASDRGNTPLPIGNNGSRKDARRPDASSASGSKTGAMALPNGNGSGGTVPTGNNGKGSEPSRQSPGGDPEPHARPPRTASVSPPVTPGVRRVTTAAVLAVAVVAGAASYDHQQFLAELAGEGWLAYLFPVSVDGLTVAASMSMLVRRRANEPAGTLAWCALLLGLAASLAANVIAADPSLVDPVLVRRVVAAWPPLALGLSFELLLQQLREASGHEAERR
jgi:hypothetical protein